MLLAHDTLDPALDTRCMLAKCTAATWHDLLAAHHSSLYKRAQRLDDAGTVVHLPAAGKTAAPAPSSTAAQATGRHSLQSQASERLCAGRYVQRSQASLGSSVHKALCNLLIT